ncbi:hypothetical protein FB382_001812 [Nocardioides ginsengisegetis]|uniref:DUF222 domain-containing protein n=1 Tax=Nocardioides ginsengisegetis TaxID=661491 RepID=A0A7W3IZK9_9ACTN|nr:hypothetical protein [Nocardioides ginsengisegetis]MBA8803521.1 hypothetical protein [Nocardioides ginsengisegetis]
MAHIPVTDLDAGDTLALLGDVVTRRRQAEVEDLLLVLHWCDLHASDPRDDPRPDPTIPLPPGSDRLVDLGGEGTPRVRELSLCELGIARGVHTLSARAAAADALDLRHRLPQTWTVTRTGRAEPWLARKVAVLTRDLPLALVDLVDQAVARAIGSQSPARVIALVEAKIIEADPATHATRLEEARHRRYVSLSRTDAVGLRHVIARVNAGDAAYVDAVVTRVADILATRPEHADAPRDLLRSLAFGWLARPAELLQLLLEHTEQPEDAEPVEDHTPRALAFPADLLDALKSAKPETFRPTSILYVHLHEAALTGTASGVARVEGIGPVALAQLTELLAHTRVSIKPVIDLKDLVSSCAYEHPEAIKERIHLRQPLDCFPHATRVSRKVDVDHPVPYRPTGPPGQTSSHTGRPLSRTAHRAKTHLGYRVATTGTGETLWRTPQGLHRLVDAAGTHELTETDARAWLSPDPLDRALVRLQHQFHTGQLTLGAGRSDTSHR